MKISNISKYVFDYEEILVLIANSIGIERKYLNDKLNHNESGFLNIEIEMNNDSIPSKPTFR